MKRSLLKVLGLALILSATITITLIAITPPQKTSRLPQSRFGLKGELVYIVTQLAPSLDQPNLRPGDMIKATSIGGQIRDIEEFQQGVRKTVPNTAIQATILRFNPLTANFEELQTEMRTSPIPQRPSLSRLSLIGQVGFLIKEIDPAMDQPDLKVGDVISTTSLGGQITNIKKFQQSVRATALYTAIQATILRFNPLTANFEEQQTVLRTIPFPPTPRKQKSESVQASQEQDENCDVECYWCCERYIGDPPGVQCALSACETGKTHCEIRNGNCQFRDCV